MSKTEQPQMVLLKKSSFDTIANYIASQPYANVVNIFPLLQEATLVEENKEETTDAPTLTPVEEEREIVEG